MSEPVWSGLGFGRFGACVQPNQQSPAQWRKENRNNLFGLTPNSFTELGCGGRNVLVFRISATESV